MNPNDAAVVYEHFARQGFLLIAVLGGLLILAIGLLPLGCPHHGDACPEYRRKRKPDTADLRERLFGRQVSDGQDVDDPSGQPGEREGDIPGIVVPDGPADPTARPVEVEAPDPPRDAPSP